jgi:hypothetical protein
MKKISILFLLFVLSATSFSQKANPLPSLTQWDYLRRSRKVKTTAWFLLGQGVAFTALGLTHPDFIVKNAEEPGIATQLVVAGFVSMAGSVLGFIVSSMDRKKALSLLFKYEKFSQICKSSFVYRAIPSLNLKISL